MSDDRDLLRELGKELPVARVDAGRSELARARLLAAIADETAASERRSPHRWRFVGGGFAGGIAAAAAVALLVFQRAPVVAGAAPVPVLVDDAQHAATIVSSAAAELEHATTATEEIVRVRGGTVRLAVVDAAKPVVVKAGDAEIGGAGAYEVVVEHDRLAEVVVTAGHATLTVPGQHTVLLAAGETWKAPAIERTDLTPPATMSTPPPTTPAVAATTPAVVAAIAPATIATPKHATTNPNATPTPTPPANIVATTTPPATTATPAVDVAAPARTAGKTPTETQFAAGWASLRADRFAEAAAELGAAADRDDGPLAADARYFQAVALAKAGNKPAAERAYLQFLDRAPHTLRRGRAAVALARLIAERGDRAGARAWFQSAAGDPDPAVAAAAAAGLAPP